jgi:hypothetical protein
MKLRQWLLSITVFALMLGALASVDARVRDRFVNLFTGGDGISSWDNRVMDLGGALIAAVKYQAIDNSPMMIFAVVGVVLFFFMVRT